MRLVLVFGRDDPARVRFAVSPLWETLVALRVLLEPRRRSYHLPWLDLVRLDLDRLDLWPLLVLSPRTGWTPDFLTPAPAGPGTDIADQLAQVRATAPEQVAQEVRRSLTERSGEPAPEAAWRLLDDLDPRAHWTGHSILIDGPAAGRHRLGGAGLLLMPSVFVWPDLAAMIDPPAQPALVYPARGIAELWQPAPTQHSEALARLLGRTRAALLESLAEPASTHTLARRHGLAPSTVSEHMATLHGARLVTRRRHRHDVLYQQAPLGAELANGERKPL